MPSLSVQMNFFFHNGCVKYLWHFDPSCMQSLKGKCHNWPCLRISTNFFNCDFFCGFMCCEDEILALCDSKLVCWVTSWFWSSWMKNYCGRDKCTTISFFKTGCYWDCYWIFFSKAGSYCLAFTPRQWIWWHLCASGCAGVAHSSGFTECSGGFVLAPVFVCSKPPFPRLQELLSGTWTCWPGSRSLSCAGNGSYLALGEWGSVPVSWGWGQSKLGESRFKKPDWSSRSRWGRV